MLNTVRARLQEGMIPNIHYHFTILLRSQRRGLFDWRKLAGIDIESLVGLCSKVQLQVCCTPR